MMEDATQPATQLEIDPRRLGNHGSGLNAQDLVDVFCILHPASPQAYQVTTNIAQAAPQLTVSTDDADETSAIEERVNHRYIALRLSANLKDPLEGFCFGRNPKRCDFVIRQDDMRRISNVHFKIYINRFGSIMLEDTSTNGTVIDNEVLRARNRTNGSGLKYRNVLQHGAVITLLHPPEGDIKFIVRIPFREEEEQDAYNENVQEHLQRKHDLGAEREADAAAYNALNQGNQPAMQPKSESNAPVNISIHAKEWKGGNRYNKVGVIGKGAFATVFKITSKYDGVPFAAKEIEKRRFIKNGIMDVKVETEMKIMRKIKHENIVQFVEDVNWEGFLYIIMEYVPNGDLGALIAKERTIPEPVVKTMTVQLLDALQYLHEMGITHRDIKPDNILIQTIDPFLVKLTDFGLSKMVEDSETFLRTFCGTLLYCAPEVYSEYREYDTSGTRQHRSKDKSLLPPQKYDSAVDLWSLAGVLFYSLSGSPPYPAPQGTTYRELLHGIMTTPLDIRPLQRRHVSDNAIRFLRSMLQVRPHLRPSIEQLLASKWVRSDENEEDDEEEEEEDDEQDNEEDDEEDYDEVDMIGNNVDEEELEKNASQLSISQVQDSGDEGLDLGDPPKLSDPFPHIRNKELRETRKEIPSSFIDDDSSSVNESFGFMKTAPGNDRLFGEVNSSAVGSSGILPNRLNLPHTTFGGVNNFTRQGTANIEEASFGGTTQQQTERQNTPYVYGTPYHHRTESDATARPFQPEHGWYLPSGTAPSLLGAETHFGQLRMESPDTHPSPNNLRDTPMVPRMTNAQGMGSPPTTGALYHRSISRAMSPPAMSPPAISPPAMSPPAMSPPALSSTATTPPAMSHGSMSPPALPPQTLPYSHGHGQSISTTNFTSSTRRREDSEDGERAAKRPKSSRRIDIPVPKTVFWDPKDKSTHHYNYPRMDFSEWTVLNKAAMARGEERYVPEPKDWLAIQAEEDRLAEERRSVSRDPSVDPGTPSTELGFADERSTVRGESVESNIRGRTPLMRDERQLSDDVENINPRGHSSANDPSKASTHVKFTSDTKIAGSNQDSRPSRPAPDEPVLPVGIKFRTFTISDPVYAMLSTVSESVVKDITIPITTQITTYGRSNDNLARHDDSWETRVPKHAFKLVAWCHADSTTTPWYEQPGIRFYVASKSRHSARINGKRLPTFEMEDTHGTCKHWGELFNGDTLTVWTGDEGAVSFKFETWIGKAAKGRGNEKITKLDHESAEVMDEWVVAEERKRLAEKAERESKEREGEKTAEESTT